MLSDFLCRGGTRVIGFGACCKTSDLESACAEVFWGVWSTSDTEAWLTSSLARTFIFSSQASCLGQQPSHEHVFLVACLQTKILWLHYKQQTVSRCWDKWAQTPSITIYLHILQSYNVMLFLWSIPTMRRVNRNITCLSLSAKQVFCCNSAVVFLWRYDYSYVYLVPTKIHNSKQVFFYSIKMS